MTVQRWKGRTIALIISFTAIYPSSISILAALTSWRGDSRFSNISSSLSSVCWRSAPMHVRNFQRQGCNVATSLREIERQPSTRCSSCLILLSRMGYKTANSFVLHSSYLTRCNGIWWHSVRWCGVQWQGVRRNNV